MITNTNTPPVKTGKSLLFTASSIVRPRPGQANTASATKVPFNNPANNNVDSVIGWISEFLNACFQITAVGLAPLPRANLMNSESSISSIEDRVILKYPAIELVPTTIAGMMKYLMSNPSPRNPLGNHSCHTENNSTITIPNQKFGIA